jgi:hypothetical protein
MKMETSGACIVMLYFQSVESSIRIRSVIMSVGSFIQKLLRLRRRTSGWK